MSSRHRVADEPRRHPNCLGSIRCPISFKIHSTTNSSKTLDIHDVRELSVDNLFLWEESLLGLEKYSQISIEKGR